MFYNINLFVVILTAGSSEIRVVFDKILDYSVLKKRLALESLYSINRYRVLQKGHH